MDIRKNFRYLIVHLEDKNEYFKVYDFLSDNDFNYNDISDSILNYPNYIIISIHDNRILFLTNTREATYELLEELVLREGSLKAYNYIFDVSEKHLQRILFILKYGKDISKPKYSPKKIIKENSEYKYNGWVIFKTNSIEETKFIVDSLPVLQKSITQVEYPNYLFYSINLKKIINMGYEDDNDAIRFINNTNRTYGYEFNDDRYIIPNIFDKDSAPKLDFIRKYGKNMPTYSPKKMIRESSNYIYNEYIVFKVYSEEEAKYVIENLPTEMTTMIEDKRYPLYIFYNFNDDYLTTVYVPDYDAKTEEEMDEYVYDIIDNVNLNSNDENHVIRKFFNHEDVKYLDLIRKTGSTKPTYTSRKISKFESFLNEEVEPVMIPDWEKLDFGGEDDEKLKLQYVKELGKKGELLDYIKQGKEKLTFGILRALFNDAIAYKKKRELTKGFYKFVHRAVPIALAAFWFPVWVLAQVLGGSRALNKILIPVLKMNPSNYKSFLVTLITKTMDLMEGEIKTFMGDDWYYRVFMVDWGLIRMIRKEHIYNFALHVAAVMENEPDDKIVPIYYIENEMRKWLNDTFNIVPPMPPKTEEIITESVDYSYIKKFLD